MAKQKGSSGRGKQAMSKGSGKTKGSTSISKPKNTDNKFKKDHSKKKGVLLAGQVVDLKEQIDSKFVDLRKQSIAVSVRRKEQVALVKEQEKTKVVEYAQQKLDMEAAITALSGL